jgi:hypothetical protein
VDGAAGQVRTYQGAVISGQYTESNGGWTSADPAHPYLVAKADPSGANEPGWTTLFSAQNVLAQCHPELANNTMLDFAVLGREGGGPGGGRITGIRVDSRTSAGVRLAHVLTGLELTQCLRRFFVESAFFTFTATPAPQITPAVAFTTKGVPWWAQTFGGPTIALGTGPGGVDIGGATRDMPAMVLLPNGDFRVFVTGTNGALYSRDYRSSTGNMGPWRGWGGSIVGRPAPVVMPDRSIGVYAQAANGRVYEAAFTAAGAFRGWFNLNGPAIVPGTGPGVATTGGGVLLAVNGGPSGIWTRSYVPGRGWGGWTGIGGSAFGSLSAISPAAGVIELYSTAPAADPAHRDVRVQRFAKGVWGAPQSLGGTVLDAPATTFSAGRTGLVALDRSLGSALRIRTAAGWGPWRPLD